VVHPPAELPDRDQLRRLRAELAKYTSQIERIHAATHDITTLDGKLLKLLDVRNAVAHGDDLQPLDRLQVDAIKRHLALDAGDGEPTILQALAQVSLR